MGSEFVIASACLLGDRSLYSLLGTVRLRQSTLAPTPLTSRRSMNFLDPLSAIALQRSPCSLPSENDRFLRTQSFGNAREYSRTTPFCESTLEADRKLPTPLRTCGNPSPSISHRIRSDKNGAESGLAAFGIDALRADVPFPQAVDAIFADLGDPASCAQVLIWMKP